MSFDAAKMMLAGLVKIELPGDTLRLCDGGFVYFDGEKYASSDPEFGSIESVESLEENVGDEAPGGRLTFLPKSTAVAATLSQPEFQGSRMRFWMVRVDEATGTASDSELIGDMELDTTRLRVGRGTRRLEMEFISIADRLFLTYEGNVLSPRFHRSVWSGEAGLDNATGVPVTVAWGVAGPPRGSTFAGSGGGFGGGGGSGGTGGFAYVGLGAPFQT